MLNRKLDVTRFLMIYVLCNLFCRYNDLRLRIFSQYPDLFPEEVPITFFVTIVLFIQVQLGPCMENPGKD